MAAVTIKDARGSSLTTQERRSIQRIWQQGTVELGRAYTVGMRDYIFYIGGDGDRQISVKVVRFNGMAPAIATLTIVK